MNVGILTSGGLCPGLNTVVKTLVLKESKTNHVFGFKHGFKGLNENDYVYMNDNMDMLNDDGGCCLGTSRFQLSMERAETQLENLSKLYCIGGNGTLNASKILADNSDVNIVGIAKTIDNDIHDVESFGTYTAVEQTRRFIKAAHVEAHGMNSVVFVETMGRNSGFIAVQSSLCENSLVDVCLSPEIPFDDNKIFEKLSALKRGVVVVAEGCNYSHITKRLTGNDVKCKIMVPSYSVRAVPPNSYDMSLCVSMAHEAFELSRREKNIVVGTDKHISLEHFRSGEAPMRRDRPEIIFLKEIGIILT